MISYKGTRGGHVVAAWVGPDVAYFDSNFGEYWFERRDDFVRWFPRYWQLSRYGRTFGGCQVRDFALKAGHVSRMPGAHRGRV